MDKRKTILTHISFCNYPKDDLRFIANIYIAESKELFRNKSRQTISNIGKWHELVYCILAGTQFPVVKLKPIYQKLINEQSILISLDDIKRLQASSENLAKMLRQNGYRYHTQKSKVIFNAANFFIDYSDGDIIIFITSNNNDYRSIRNVLMKSINGIGIKIASHWLRNIGYDICTIDIHLRRLLLNLGITNDSPNKSLSNENFILLENQFRNLSKILDENLGVLQYSIWEFTRNYCNLNRCWECPLQKRCEKGKLVIAGNLLELNKRP